MNRLTTIAAAAALSLGAGVAPASAQTQAQLDTIAAACSGDGATCDAVVAAILNEVLATPGLTPAQINRVVGNVAQTVATSSNSPAARARLSVTIRNVVAPRAATPEATAALDNFGQSVASNNANAAATNAPFAQGSPS